uniref:Putative salp15 n=1 Tax=Ixodes ricinus TaxID=34613 RepID=A0A0K8R4H2_IXORI
MMVAHFHLLMIFLQIASSITSAGGDSIELLGGIKKLAPSCEATVKKQCQDDKLRRGPITKIDVQLRECSLLCYSEGGRYVSQMQLPNDMPCALGAKCQDGTCYCEACKKK